MAYISKDWTGNEYFKINDFDYVEFYVGNAKQVVHFYRSAFGFKPYAYCGPETGIETHVSYVLKSNKIFFVFTSPLKSSHDASKWIKKHGDGVRDIGFSVESVESSYNSCMERGAFSNQEPFVSKDKNVKLWYLIPDNT